MSLGGRPKEEGGHKSLKISVNKFVREALEKVPNKSKFLEKVARPVLEKMDPGDASVFLWKIDDFLSQGIIRATQERDFKQVSALSWLANCLADARKLCGVPPPNFHLPSTEKLRKLCLSTRARKTAQEFPLGDINCDGKVNVVDMLALKIILSAG